MLLTLRGGSHEKPIFWVIFFIAIVIAGTMGKELGKASFKGFSAPTSQAVEKELILGFQMVAKQFNEKGPTMVDEITRLDRVSVGPGARVTYHHTILQEINWSQFKTKMRPEIIKKICNKKEMKASLEYGAMYVYSYSGKGNNKVVSLEFDRNDCGF